MKIIKGNRSELEYDALRAVMRDDEATFDHAMARLKHRGTLKAVPAATVEQQPDDKPADE